MLLIPGWDLPDSPLTQNPLRKSFSCGVSGRVLRQVLLGCWRGSPVAVKLLKEEVVQTSPSALANFQREAKLLQDLRHPNVIEFFGSCLDLQPVWFS